MAHADPPPDAPEPTGASDTSRGPMSNRSRRLAVSRLHRRVGENLSECGLSAGANLVVAVSGGPDSLALLYALHRLAPELGLRLHVAHLDHRLRGDASRDDADFVTQTCRGLDVACTIDEADVPTLQGREGLSLEEAARTARYAFLAGVARERGADAVALGHTADDQAETVLMHLMRGSALSGLRGMETLSVRVIDGVKVALTRPLLNVWRRETLEYCRARGLNPREDASNLSHEPTRNRVRLELLPHLETYNPSVRQALVRLANAAADDVDYIEGRLDDEWDRVARERDGDIVIDAEALGKLHRAIGSHLLSRAISAVKGDLVDIEQGHLNDMARLITGPAGRSLDLPGGLRFDVGYGEAVIGRAGTDRCPLPPLDGEHSLSVPGETLLPGWRVSAKIFDSVAAQSPPDDDARDSHVACVDYDVLEGGLTLRSRRPGDRIQPLGMAHHKKLQDFMVDEKIPRSWRDRVPLVVSPQGIAWVVGWRVAHWARVTGETKRILELRFEVR